MASSSSVFHFDSGVSNGTNNGLQEGNIVKKRTKNNEHNASYERTLRY